MYLPDSQPQKHHITIHLTPNILLVLGFYLAVICFMNPVQGLGWESGIVLDSHFTKPYSLLYLLVDLSGISSWEVSGGVKSKAAIEINMMVPPFLLSCLFPHCFFFICIFDVSQ